MTMLQISQAVNKFAYWLEHTIGRSTAFETVSYMGIPDLRYAIVFLAAVKCGYKVSDHALAELAVHYTDLSSFWYHRCEILPG